MPKLCRFVLAILLYGMQRHIVFAEEAGWTPSNPGFSVHVVTANGNSIWAAGANESIAASYDGGLHWQQKHSNQKGGLLLTLRFVNEHFGYAAGGGGVVLFTEDAGESWVSHKLAGETILQAAFGDEQHGVIRTATALLSTIDGGKSWQPVRPPNDPDWALKFQYTIDLAALDAAHLAVRVGEGPLSDGEYLWSADGGSTWNANYLPNTGIHNLLVKDGAYWSIGHEVLGKDKPSGGYGQAMVFRSHDAVTWEHLPLVKSICKSESCAGCTLQGCFASETILVDLLDGGDQLAQFPRRAHLSGQWARSNDRLCVLSDHSLECAVVRPAAQSVADEEPPEVVDEVIPPISPAHMNGQRCIRCDLSPMFVTETGNSGPIAVEISVAVNTAGETQDIKIAGDLPKDVKEKIVAIIKTWLFEPEMQNGVAVPSRFALRGKIIVMNPKKLPPARFN